MPRAKFFYAVREQLERMTMSETQKQPESADGCSLDPLFVRCDACGEPATMLARDMMLDGVVDGWAKWKPHGAWKCGCKKHPVKATRWLAEGRAAEMPAMIAEDAGRRIMLNVAAHRPAEADKKGQL